MDKCPECKTELVEVKGIGLVCPTEHCPVNDDALLWDGKGNRKDPPKFSSPASPAGSISIFRICEKCNQEYNLMVNALHPGEYCRNHLKCPHCGERDDPWIRVKVTKD